MLRALQITGFLSLAFALAAALFYLTLLAINRHDEPPSPAVQFFEQRLDKRIPVADEDNAYLHLIGLVAGQEESPYELGAAWAQWAELPRTARPSLPEPDLYSRSLPEPLQELLSSCNRPNACCTRALKKDEKLLSDLVAAERFRLQRYRALYELPHWQEPLFSVLATPFPSYTDWMHFARLGMVDAWLYSQKGQLLEAQRALEDDARLWRFVLMEADYGMTKLIATAVLRQNILWSNILSRDYNVPLPSVWHEPISTQERSLTEAFTGEYRHISKAIRASAYSSNEPHSPILRPLFQVRATENMLAEHLFTVANAVEGPLSELPDRLADIPISLQPARRWTLYNPMGTSRNITTLIDENLYGAHVGGLEGARRTLLVTFHLRQAGVAPEDVPQHLAEHELTNPYTGNPLLWDSDSNAIGFESLRHPRRDMFTLPY